MTSSSQDSITGSSGVDACLSAAICGGFRPDVRMGLTVAELSRAFIHEQDEPEVSVLQYVREKTGYTLSSFPKTPPYTRTPFCFTFRFHWHSTMRFGAYTLSSRWASHRVTPITITRSEPIKKTYRLM